MRNRSQYNVFLFRSFLGDIGVEVAPTDTLSELKEMIAAKLQPADSTSVKTTTSTRYANGFFLLCTGLRLGSRYSDDMTISEMSEIFDSKKQHMGTIMSSDRAPKSDSPFLHKK
jgi:hypothetical protein